MKMFAPPKTFRGERANERTNEKVFCGDPGKRDLIDGNNMNIATCLLAKPVATRVIVFKPERTYFGDF